MCALALCATALPGRAALAAGPRATVPANPVAAARATGRPVVVDADTTPTDVTTANPDGTFTLTRSLQAVRARRNGRWVPVDAALVRGRDGSLSPRAVNGSVTFSGGGTGPLVAEDDRAGHSLALSWPGRLPTPVVSGASATYRNVLRGVDLTVTANTQGGFGEVLVVHDATAAANPALRRLRFGLRAHGLRVVTGADGAITATDPATGAVVYSAPTPVAWDATNSSAHGPGAGARVTPLRAGVDGAGLTLDVPAAALAGSGVHYPVYVDPSLGPGRQHWTYVAENYPDQWYTDGSYGDGKARVGYDDWTSNSNHITHTFYAMGDMSRVINTYIVSAQLQMVETASSCSNSETINVSLSGALYLDHSSSSGTTWNHQPPFGTYYPANTITPVSMAGMTNGNVGVNADVTNAVRYGASHSVTTLTFALYAQNQADHCTYRYLTNNPSMQITYWSYPSVPTNPTVTVGGKGLTCSTSSANPTWVSKTDNGTVALSVTATTPDVGYPLWANYYLGINGAAPTLYSRDSPHNNAQAGANVLTVAGYPVADGSSYAWYSHASNGTVASGFNPTCYFRADETSPATALPSSADFPAQGGGKLAGQAGTFTLSGTDRGTSPSGVDHFLYTLDTTFTPGGAKATPAGSGGSYTLTGLAPSWGTNMLTVAAVDKAGNIDPQPQTYTFFAPAPPYTPGTVGDLTGDGKADLVTVDKSGNLRLYADPQPGNTGPGSTSADPLQYGGSVLIPGTANPLWQQATFAGALVTHGGSFTGKNVDDLIVVQNGQLGVEANARGDGSTWTTYGNLGKPACTVPAGFTYSSCAGVQYAGGGTDWSSVKQILDLPPATASGLPSLITIEEHNGGWGVYEYTTTAGTLGFTGAKLLAADSTSWDWGRMTLVYAGDSNGDGKPDLMVRKPSGTISVFSDVTAGINGDPSSSAITVANTTGKYLPDSYPLLTSNQAVYNNGTNPVIWAVAADGTLTGTPVTRAATPAFGASTTVAAAGWGRNLVALENSYTPYDNVSTHNNGVVFTGGNSFDGSYAAYSEQNLTGSFTPGAGFQLYKNTNGDPATGLGPDTIIGTPDQHLINWPGQTPGAENNYRAIGQTIPAPLDQSVPPGTAGTPATKLYFVGAATRAGTGITGTATLNWSDGTSQTVNLSLSDWALGTGGGGPAQPLAAGNQILGSTPGQLLLDGTVNTTQADLFLATVTLPTPPNYNPTTNPRIQLASITLPTITSPDAMHIFAVAAS